MHIRSNKTTTTTTITNETDIPQQTRVKNISKTTTDQLLQLSRFDDQSHHDKTAEQSQPRPEG